MSKQLPLVVVLGATACGKSKLAIELASRFGGEIISADSMQVYRGLDIVTNKVTEIELKKARHHMLSFVDPNQNFSVVDFRNKSLEIIDNLQKRNRLPILVGGTNYYIESLIWKSFLIGTSDSHQSQLTQKLVKEEDDEGITASKPSDTLLDTEIKVFNELPKDLVHSEEDFLDVDRFFKKKIYPTGFTNVDSERLWRILEQVDPKTAHLCHPHNRRGIIRFLQIIQEKGGKKYSDILEDVNKSSQEGKTSLGGPLRYENTCVLWLNCDNDILDRIVNERIDQMLDRGLLAELIDFHETYNKQRVLNGEKPVYDIGVFQTIGFKEFHDYLMLDSDARGTDKGKEILLKSIEEMKQSTRQYIRRQIKWIRSRFLRYGRRDLPDVFKLTTTFDEADWLKQVQEPAFEIVESLIMGRQIDVRLLHFKEEPTKNFVAYGPGKHYCEACDRTLIGNTHITEHLRSKRHHNNLTYFRRKRQKLIREIEAEIGAEATNSDTTH